MCRAAPASPAPVLLVCRKLVISKLKLRQAKILTCQRPISQMSCWRPLFDGHAGHSLGAGVASLAAPWAALQWPGADIRCVTFGNPKPGNQAYSDVSCHLLSPLLPLPSPFELSLACWLHTFNESLICLLAEYKPTLLPLVGAFLKQMFLSPLDTLNPYLHRVSHLLACYIILCLPAICCCLRNSVCRFLISQGKS